MFKNFKTMKVLSLPIFGLVAITTVFERHLRFSESIFLSIGLALLIGYFIRELKNIQNLLENSKKENK